MGDNEIDPRPEDIVQVDSDREDALVAMSGEGLVQRAEELFNKLRRDDLDLIEVEFKRDGALRQLKQAQGSSKAIGARDENIVITPGKAERLELH